MVKLHAMAGARVSAKILVTAEAAVECSQMQLGSRKGRKGDLCSSRGHSRGSGGLLSSYEWAQGNLGGRGCRPDFLAKCQLTTIPQQPPILIGGSGALSQRTFPCTSSNKIQKDARQAFVSGAALLAFGPPGVHPPFFPHALRLQLPKGRGTATAAHAQACRWCSREAVAGGPIRPEGNMRERNGGRES